MSRIQRSSVGLILFLIVTNAPSQSTPEPSLLPGLFQQLQSANTTDRADAILRERARTDPEVRRYLTVHLPEFIAKGPSEPKAWNNAVRLAGDLAILEAVPDLTKWIGSQTGIGLTGLSLELRLENDPAGKALAQIGEPAIPALADVLKQGNEAKRRDALYALRLINSQSAKDTFREHLPTESDPGLKQFMERALEVWHGPESHCGCDVIQHAITGFDQVSVGLARQVLERNNFVVGNLSSRDEGNYHYQNCDDVQLRVEFSRDPNLLGDDNYSPNDVITKISALSLRNPRVD